MAALLPPPVVAAVAAVPRPPLAGVRWESPERWHVTLRFLGAADPAAVLAALASIRLPRATAVLGPGVDTLGPRVVVVPVAGLDELAASVAAATAELGEPADPRPFRGHLTLARVGRAADPADLADVVGTPCAARFGVDEVALVASRPGPDGPRYEVAGRVRCSRREEIPENLREGVDRGGGRS